MFGRFRAAGFTLIELVVVIVILGMVSVGFARFIGIGAEIYVDAVGRDQMISQTRFMLERLTRELREALPNSVRVGVQGNIHCIEFVPIVASSSYVDIPVAPEAASNSMTLVQHAVSGISPSRIAIYPLTSNDVYGANPATATTGNVFNLNTAPTAGTGTVVATLNNFVRFDGDSPTQRYYLVNNAVSYCVDVTANSGQVRRYADYWPPVSGQEMPPSGVTGVLMGENIQTGSTPFSYATATLVANAVVQLTFRIVRNDEQIDFHHEVHLVNVP